MVLFSGNCHLGQLSDTNFHETLSHLLANQIQKGASNRFEPIFGWCLKFWFHLRSHLWLNWDIYDLKLLNNVECRNRRKCPISNYSNENNKLAAINYVKYICLSTVWMCRATWNSFVFRFNRTTFISFEYVNIVLHIERFIIKAMENFLENRINLSKMLELSFSANVMPMCQWTVPSIFKRCVMLKANSNSLRIYANRVTCRLFWL